jgi:hypothetical protein
MKKYILVSLIALQFSCNKKEARVEKEILTQKVAIDTFSSLPPEIDGCYLNYSNNESERKKRIFIYLNNTDKISFMKINGKMIKFTLISCDTLKKNIIFQKFKNNNFDLEIESIIKSLESDGTYLTSGKLKLKSKGNQIIEKKFIGECGC